MGYCTKLKSIVKEMTPPFVVKLARFARFRRLPDSVPAIDTCAIDTFYKSLIPEGSLCFDVGANIGAISASLLRIGCRVVAVEPQTFCFSKLTEYFSKDKRISLLKKAVGSSRGKSTLFLSQCSAHSSLDTNFIKSMQSSGRTGEFNDAEQVDVTTLDQLLVEFGIPFFAKIDIEGYELEALNGLSRALSLISIEWHPETTDTTLRCLDRLEELGRYEFNLTWNEIMKLTRSTWMDRQRLTQLLNLLREDTILYADILARLK